VFNDVSGERTVVQLAPLGPGARDSETWTHDPPNASPFHVGAAYVAKGRFANGEIWAADRAAVEEQLDQLGASSMLVNAGSMS
jgi:hypothetical protein